MIYGQFFGLKSDSLNEIFSPLTVGDHSDTEALNTFQD